MTFYLSEEEYDTILRRRFRPRSKQTDEALDPDYICFLFFAMTQLRWLSERHLDIERVDFCVEINGKVTKHIREFHKDLPVNLAAVGRPELARLVGNLQGVPKDSIPAQAADLLTWYTRRFESGFLKGDLDGQRRYWRMLTDGAGSLQDCRYGHESRIDSETLRQLVDAFVLSESRFASGEVLNP